MTPSLRWTGTGIGYPARAHLARGAGYMMLALLIFTSWLPARAASGPAVLVKAGFSTIGPLMSARGTLFFVANYQDALWTSDGTEAGTVMVKDLLPGPAGAYAAKLTDVNGVLVFVTTHSLDLPIGLAKSDGTSNGTVLIQDLQVADIAVIRSLMLISTYNNGRMELWAMPLSALGIKLAYLPSIKQ
jgi:ELWxxDGT repeat protein